MDANLLLCIGQILLGAASCLAVLAVLAIILHARCPGASASIVIDAILGAICR